MAADGFAPAKINLTLHVTGQRADGYHLLDSLVMFADVGDQVSLAPGGGVTLAVTGPEADGVPTDSTNSVMQAARFSGQDGLALLLVKNLPRAAGIGGGSSDAAATLRAISALRGVPLPVDVLALGADVPVCLHPAAQRMRGIGERLNTLPGLPKIWAVLANPRVAVPTPSVFDRLRRRQNPEMPARIPHFGTARVFARWLTDQRNDLQAAAIAVQPEIRQVLGALSGLPGQMLVRMSGAGATCFALFDSAAVAREAAQALACEQPGWWIVPVALS